MINGQVDMRAVSTPTTNTFVLINSDSDSRFRQLEKHVADRKPRIYQQGKYCPWSKRLYGAVQAFRSLVGFQDEKILKGINP